MEAVITAGGTMEAVITEAVITEAVITEAVITEAVGITIIGVGIQIEGLPGELQAWQLAL